MGRSLKLYPIGGAIPLAPTARNVIMLTAQSFSLAMVCRIIVKFILDLQEIWRADFFDYFSLHASLAWHLFEPQLLSCSAAQSMLLAGLGRTEVAVCHSAQCTSNIPHPWLRGRNSLWIRGVRYPLFLSANVVMNITRSHVVWEPGSLHFNLIHLLVLSFCLWWWTVKFDTKHTIYNLLKNVLNM